MLTPAEKFVARQEFESLLAFAAIESTKTKCSVRAILTPLISVPPRQRFVIERFCDANPADAIGFEHALAVRDYMLELLECTRG